MSRTRRGGGEEARAEMDEDVRTSDYRTRGNKAASTGQGSSSTSDSTGHLGEPVAR